MRTYTVWALISLLDGYQSFPLPSLSRKTFSLKADLNDRVVVLETKMEASEEARIATNNKIDKIRGELKDDIGDLKKELKEEIRAVNENLSAEIKAVREDVRAANENLSAEIKAVREDMRAANENLSAEIKAVNENLSAEIKAVNNKFVPLYIFLSVFSTATGMANFKDVVAFFK